MALITNFGLLGVDVIHVILEPNDGEDELKEHAQEGHYAQLGGVVADGLEDALQQRQATEDVEQVQ